MTYPIEAVADAIARWAPDITAKGFRELKWPDDWSKSEQAAIRRQAGAAIWAMRETE